MNELLKKFLDESLDSKEVSETYLELRKHLQELGFSENDLYRPPIYTEKMHKLRDRFSSQYSNLKKRVESFGIDFKVKEFNDYFEKIFKNIDELIPLSNEDYKRTDSGD